MSDFDINFPPWINYGVGDKENNIKLKMDELVHKVWSPFNGCDAAQVFIFCMSYAVAKRRVPRRPPGGKGSMPASAFKRDMRDFMRIVAINHEDDLNVIKDPKDVVRIAEDYAYAGFLDVYDKVHQGNKKRMSPQNILRELLRDAVDEDKN